MPSLPPATQALLLANVAVFFLQRAPGRALLRPPRALAERQRQLLPLAGAELLVPARQLRAPVLQHAGPLDVRLGARAGLGPEALRPVLHRERARRGADAARRLGGARLGRADDRRLGRPVWPAARVRDDLPEP